MRFPGVGACLALLLAPGIAGAASGPIAVAVDAPEAREAIARVAYAEAAGQGDSGLAGVVFTILNRVQAGRWGATVEAVVNARGQFEPVMRAGGDWRALKPVTAAQRARIDTILNLALEGRLPDLTGGARYFQNPALVAARARAGSVAPGLVNFGGTAPSAVIGDHAFYIAPKPGRAGAPTRPDSEILTRPVRGAGAPASGRGLFILADGQVVEDPREVPSP
jgi:N-acetylmuramoyl-L-alanine amidase